MLRELSGLVPTAYVRQALVGYLTIISLADGRTTTTFGPDFMGFYMDGAGIDDGKVCPRRRPSLVILICFKSGNPVRCDQGDGSTYCSWNTYAGCCTTAVDGSQNNFATECKGNTLYDRFGSSMTWYVTTHPTFSRQSEFLGRTSLSNRTAFVLTLRPTIAVHQSPGTIAPR